MMVWSSEASLPTHLVASNTITILAVHPHLEDVKMKIMLAALGLLLIVASTAIAQTSVTLTWTSVGDDGLSGTASQYDLRHSTSPITAANFNAATRWTTGMPVPLPPGTSQSVIVAGLAYSTTYYFAIKTGDESGNWATISNVATKTTIPAPDVTRPAALVFTPGAITDTSVTVNFTAVGNDSLTGTAAVYDFRYSPSPITSANWASAIQATGEPVPAAAGTAQSFKFTGLSRQVQYYFAGKVSDAVGNTSGLSNVLGVSTTDTMTPAAITTLVAS